MRILKVLIIAVLLAATLSGCMLKAGSSSRADTMLSISSFWRGTVNDIKVTVVFGPNIQAQDIISVRYIKGDTAFEELYTYYIQHGYLYVEPSNIFKTTAVDGQPYNVPAEEECEIFKSSVYTVDIRDEPAGDIAVVLHSTTGEIIFLTADDVAHVNFELS